MGQDGLPSYTLFCQTNSEGGVPELGMPHPARDYPSAPSVDLKHDWGNCAVGDVKDRWKESKVGRGHHLNRGGWSAHYSVSVKIWRQARKEGKKFPFQEDAHLLCYLRKVGF